MPKDVTCYFCGETRDQGVEHFFSKSSRKVYPIRTDVRGQYYADGKLIKTDPGSVGTSPAKDICKYCNNGWMSILQNSAKDYINPWMVGNAPQFDSNVVEVIAKWAVMTSMTIDSIDPNFICIPEQERRDFAASQTISANWQIWAGSTSAELDRGWRHAPIIDQNGIRCGQTTVMLNGMSVFVMSYNSPKVQSDNGTSFGAYALYPTLDVSINNNTNLISIYDVRDLPELLYGHPRPRPVGS